MLIVATSAVPQRLWCWLTVTQCFSWSVSQTRADLIGQKHQNLALPLLNGPSSSQTHGWIIEQEACLTFTCPPTYPTLQQHIFFFWSFCISCFFPTYVLLLLHFFVLLFASFWSYLVVVLCFILAVVAIFRWLALVFCFVVDFSALHCHFFPFPFGSPCE